MERQIGDCRLILGDCLSVLPTFDRVDAVVMDPPYELTPHGPFKSNFGITLGKFWSKGYDDIITGFDHESVFDLLDSICKPFNMFCFCSNKQISKIMSYHENKGRTATLIFWHKTNAAPFTNYSWRSDVEYVIHTRDEGGVFEGNPRQKKKVSEFPAVIDNDHPTVKPLDLMKKYVKICSHPGQIILDPFMGSGTTGVACAKLGRKFIGIEKDEQYFNLACKRIEEAYAQPDLFGETL